MNEGVTDLKKEKQKTKNQSFKLVPAAVLSVLCVICRDSHATDLDFQSFKRRV